MRIVTSGLRIADSAEKAHLSLRSLAVLMRETSFSDYSRSAIR